MSFNLANQSLVYVSRALHHVMLDAKFDWTQVTGSQLNFTIELEEIVVPRLFAAVRTRGVDPKLVPMTLWLYHVCDSLGMSIAAHVKETNRWPLVDEFDTIINRLLNIEVPLVTKGTGAL